MEDFNTVRDGDFLERVETMTKFVEDAIGGLNVEEEEKGAGGQSEEEQSCKMNEEDPKLSVLQAKDKYKRRILEQAKQRQEAEKGDAENWVPRRCAEVNFTDEMNLSTCWETETYCI